MRYQQFQLKFILLITSIFFCLFNSNPTALSQELGDEIHNRLQNVAAESGFDAGTIDAQTLPETIGNIIKIILTFLGVVFLILVIYGGFMWMTARGNEERVEKATKLLTESVIGLAIVLGAYLITFFVVNALIGQTGYQG